MRLAIVRQRYTPYGGAERFVARALAALERAGTEVTLIARSWEGWGARRVLRVNPPYVGSWWRDASFARAAFAAWRREGFDLVQSHERIPGCDVYRAGDGVHRRWLELRRTAEGATQRLGIALNPHHRYLCKVEKRMFEHSRLRAVICNSRMVLDEVRRNFRIAPEKLHVIYNGVDLEHFHPRHGEALRAAARAELACAPEDTVFLFVGSGFFRKGLATAIQALALARNPSWRLVVAGQDRHQARYERLAGQAGVAPQVRFLGGRRDVRPLYAAADCFVLPSRYDPFPNTALEALAMGVPVIVSSRCGAAEAVDGGVNGWICAPEDARGLAEWMAQAADAARAGRATEAARASAESFGIDAMAQKLTGLYRTLGTHDRTH
jgi:UDP-glucose:(heptosyl)LPS alpha-1,3-glucosyltransferase